MTLCKKMNVVAVKLDPHNPDTITWDELEKYEHKILWQDPFFRWKAIAEVCFKRLVEIKENDRPEVRFMHLYLHSRGVEEIRPNHVLFRLRYLAKRLNRTSLLKMIGDNGGSSSL